MAQVGCEGEGCEGGGTGRWGSGGAEVMQRVRPAAILPVSAFELSRRFHLWHQPPRREDESQASWPMNCLRWVLDVVRELLHALKHCGVPYRSIELWEHGSFLRSGTILTHPDGAAFLAVLVYVRPAPGMRFFAGAILHDEGRGMVVGMRRPPADRAWGAGSSRRARDGGGRCV